jgi:hypothetical protein
VTGFGSDLRGYKDVTTDVTLEVAKLPQLKDENMKRSERV